MKYLRLIEKHINYWTKLLLIFGILIILTPSSLCNGDELMNVELKYPTYFEMIQKRINYIESQEFEYSLMLEYVDLVGINNKFTVISQSILETNTFKSDIFIENNNLFGMKQPSVRPTTATGTNRNHATYEHWTCSVKDYKLWYEYMTRNKTYYNYYSFLTNIGYAEDVQYIGKLKTIKNNLN